MKYIRMLEEVCAKHNITTHDLPAVTFETRQLVKAQFMSAVDMNYCFSEATARRPLSDEESERRYEAAMAKAKRFINNQCHPVQTARY